MDNLLLSDMTVGHPNAYEIGLNKGQSTEVLKWWQGPILKRKPLSVDVMRSPKRKGGECKLNVEHLTF